MALEQGTCTSSLLLPFPYIYTGLGSQYRSMILLVFLRTLDVALKSCLPPDPTLEQTQFPYQKNLDIRSGRHCTTG